MKILLVFRILFHFHKEITTLICLINANCWSVSYALNTDLLLEKRQICRLSTQSCPDPIPLVFENNPTEGILMFYNVVEVKQLL